MFLATAANTESVYCDSMRSSEALLQHKASLAAFCGKAASVHTSNALAAFTQPACCRRFRQGRHLSRARASMTAVRQRASYRKTLQTCSLSQPTCRMLRLGIHLSKARGLMTAARQIASSQFAANKQPTCRKLRLGGTCPKPGARGLLQDRKRRDTIRCKHAAHLQEAAPGEALVQSQELGDLGVLS